LLTQGGGTNPALVGQLHELIPGPGQEELGLLGRKRGQQMLRIEACIQTLQGNVRIGKILTFEGQEPVWITAGSLTTATEVHGRSAEHGLGVCSQAPFGGVVAGSPL
jgi:hypothetical protein